MKRTWIAAVAAPILAALLVLGLFKTFGSVYFWMLLAAAGALLVVLYYSLATWHKRMAGLLLTAAAGGCYSVFLAAPDTIVSLNVAAGGAAILVFGAIAILWLEQRQNQTDGSTQPGAIKGERSNSEIAVGIKGKEGVVAERVKVHGAPDRALANIESSNGRVELREIEISTTPLPAKRTDE